MPRGDQTLAEFFNSVRLHDPPRVLMSDAWKSFPAWNLQPSHALSPQWGNQNKEQNFSESAYFCLFRGPHLNAARAEPSAVQLLDAAASPVWGAAKLGHLVHMSSHTFVRIGRWADAVTANVAAWRADVADAAACQSPYEPEHNTDMLVYAANMAGQVRTCLGSSVTSDDVPRLGYQTRQAHSGHF